MSLRRNWSLKRSRLISVIFIIQYFLFYGIQTFKNWPGLESTRGWAPRYWDLKWVISWSECFRSYGLSIYNYDANDKCTGYIYGSQLVKLLNLLHVSVEQSNFLGHLNLIVMCLIISLLSQFFSNQFNVNRIFLSLAFLSPGIWLLLASGNFDSLMFTCILFGIISAGNGRIGLAAILFAVASLVKFYSLPLIPLLFLFCSKKRQTLIVFITSLISLYLTIGDLSRTSSQSPGPNNYFFTFGIQNFGTWLEILNFKFTSHYDEFKPSVIYLIGFVLIMLVTSSMYLIFRQKNYFSFQSKSIFFNDTMSEIWFVFFAATYLALYFQGTNYDYKLIFYIMTFLILMTSDAFRPLKRLFAPIFLLSLWLTCFSFGFKSSFYPTIRISTNFTLIEFFGDILNLVVTGLIFLVFILVMARKFPVILNRFRRQVSNG